MARISLLFSLVFVLAISAATAHPPKHKKTQKTLCPSTLSGLQRFPYTELSKHIAKKVESASNTTQFSTLFSICKAYNDFLGVFNVKFSNDVFASVHAKYAVMTKAMLAAQASVGVDGELAVKLRKSYTVMAEGYGAVIEKIAEISVKHKFEANATISKSDRIKMDTCLIKLKGSVTVYLKMVTLCTKKFSAGAKVGSIAGAMIGAKAGAKVGGKAGALIGAKAGAKIGGKAGAKIGAKAGAKVGAKAGASVDAKVGVNGGAGAKSNAGVLFYGYYGGEGKGKIVGGGGKLRPQI